MRGGVLVWQSELGVEGSVRSRDEGMQEEVFWDHPRVRAGIVRAADALRSLSMRRCKASFSLYFFLI